MTNSNNELRSLIDAAAGTSDTPKAAPKRAPTSAPPAAAGREGSDDLYSLIARVHAPGTGAPVDAQRTTPRAAPVPADLERAIHSTHSGASTNRHAAAAARQLAGAPAAADDLDQVVQQVHTADPAGAHAAGRTSALGRPRVVAAALALGLVVGALWLWKSTQPTLTGPAATLQQLAQSVEKYRGSRNGSLPGQLSTLEHFPRDAVEWQLKHWRARDAKGRTEIIWAPNGPKHYRIVLRHGSAVWIYSDVDGKSKQTNQ